MVQLILIGLAAGALWIIASKGWKGLQLLFRQGISAEGPNPINSQQNPLGWLDQKQRELTRSTDNRNRYHDIPKLAGVGSFQTTDTIVYIDNSLPLKRSAGMKLTGYFECKRIIGHPVAIAFLAHAIQTMDHLREGGNSGEIKHWGCYNITRSPNGWHNFGLALDLDPAEYDNYIYHARKRLGLHCQWCDPKNDYYLSTEEAPGSKRVATCTGDHVHHLHLEITPDARAWALLNHINVQHTKSLTSEV